MTTTLEHPPVQKQLPAHATGVLDIAHNGQGYLRAAESCLPTPTDVQVSAALIRRHGLRKGDTVEGVRGGPRASPRSSGSTAAPPKSCAAARTSTTSPRCTRATGSAWSTRRAAWPDASSTWSPPSARASAV